MIIRQQKGAEGSRREQKGAEGSKMGKKKYYKNSKKKNKNKNNSNNSPGLRPIGVLDPLQIPARVCLECSQTAQSGRPRALGGGSRWHVAGVSPGQSPAESWRPVICKGS